MLQVVYVTPNFTLNAVRFIEALVSRHDLRLFLVSQESYHLLPSWQQSRISIARQLPDVSDSKALIGLLSDIQSRTGPIHRIISASEPLQIPLAEAREALGVEGMDVKTAHHFRDKSKMKLLFEHAGIPCAKHRLAGNIKEALSLADSLSYPLVIKPVSGAGSQTTYTVRNASELKWVFDQPGTNANAGMIMEEFIQGDEYSLDTFSHNGKIISQTINQYFPNPLEVMTHPWMQWRVMLRRETTGKDFDDIREFGRKALDVLGMKTGMSHMEWFRKKDGGIAISEVAARPPGAQFTTLISRACDFDAVKAWVELMVYGKVEFPEIMYTSGAAYLRSQGGDRISGITGMETIRRKYNDIITDVRLPKPGQEKSTSYEGEGFVIMRHHDSNIVEQALRDVVETVKIF